MPRPSIYEHPIRVEPKDIDRMGHVNNVVYLRYAQDAAVAHWKATARPEHQAAFLWVARRHEIDYLKPALPGDALVARTWVGEVNGATFERFVEIVRPADGAVVATVRSVWAALDAATRRLRRVTEDLRADFQQPDEAAGP